MSIAARVVPFSRSARTLIKRQRGEPRHIKVLQTLGCSVVQDAIDIKVLQTLGMARETRSPARVAGEGPRATVTEGFLSRKTASPLRRARACPSPCCGLPDVREGQAPALRKNGS